MIYHYLGIDQESHISQCDSVSSDIIDDWQDPFTQGEGPHLDKLQFDWLSGRKSDWNAKTIELLAIAIKNEAEARWSHLPRYELFYWEESIWQKFRNLATIWKAFQQKCIGPSLEDFESRESAVERTDEKQIARRKKSRQATRRHTVS